MFFQAMPDTFSGNNLNLKNNISALCNSFVLTAAVVLTATSFSPAQAIKISGTVLKKDLSAIADATVKLVNANLTATTGADGTFLLTEASTNSSVTKKSGIQQPSRRPQQHGGNIIFDIANSASLVNIDLYSLRGERLNHCYNENLSTGSYIPLIRLQSRPAKSGNA